MYDREALLAAIDLPTLADELLGARSGGRSAMWPCPNPQHAQTGRTPPVSVFTTNRGEQRWRCHGCGDGGTAIDLVLACRGGNLRSAFDYLAGSAGHIDHDDTWEPPARPQRPPPRPTGCRDPKGLQRYVDECAERLWTPEGEWILEWLTVTRGLPRDVLARNRIGADLGPARQSRPDGLPKAGGAVLPVISNDQAIYAQIRVPQPRPDRPKYLNPTADLASNPRMARIRPPVCEHPEVIVTEGTIDALSAASAGYRSVAVLSAAYGDRSVALALARLPHPLVLAFDADEAGRRGADQLAAQLEVHKRPPIVLDLGWGDLNEAMNRSQDWPAQLSSAALYETHAGCSGVGLGR